MSIDLVSIDWLAFHRVVYIEWREPWDNPDDDDSYGFVMLETIGM